MGSLSTKSARSWVGNPPWVWAVLVVLIAVVIALASLPQPYDAIGEVVAYAGLVTAVASKLRACLRLARGSESEPLLRVVRFWVVIAVFPVIVRLLNLFSKPDRDYIRMADYIRLAMNGSVYMALLSAMDVIERLLKRSGDGASVASMVEGREIEGLDVPAPTSLRPSGATDDAPG
jgi:hypothetical protein